MPITIVALLYFAPVVGALINHILIPLENVHLSFMGCLYISTCFSSLSNVCLICLYSQLSLNGHLY